MFELLSLYMKWYMDKWISRNITRDNSIGKICDFKTVLRCLRVYGFRISYKPIGSIGYYTASSKEIKPEVLDNVQWIRLEYPGERGIEMDKETIIKLL